MSELKITYRKVEELVPYAKNPRKNKEAVDYVARSIKEFGFKNPIIIDKDDTIVAGHTRLLAAKKLKMEEVPCITADDLTEEQIRAFRLADNKTNEFAEWDQVLLDEELENILNIDMELFGFLTGDQSTEGEGEDDKYTFTVNIPQYEITGECPKLSECVDTTKTDELLDRIEAADVPEDIKEFLSLAAQRHTVFNYRNIAEYYAHADADVQELFEDSALVIIDVDDAIRNGFATLNESILEMVEEENEG